MGDFNFQSEFSNVNYGGACRALKRQRRRVGGFWSGLGGVAVVAVGLGVLAALFAWWQHRWHTCLHCYSWRDDWFSFMEGTALSICDKRGANSHRYHPHSFDARGVFCGTSRPSIPYAMEPSTWCDRNKGCVADIA